MHEKSNCFLQMQENPRSTCKIYYMYSFSQKWDCCQAIKERQLHSISNAAFLTLLHCDHECSALKAKISVENPVPTQVLLIILVN